MDDDDVGPQTMRKLREKFRIALREFAASQSTFRVLSTVPDQNGSTGTSSSTAAVKSKLKTLYVLDSSFNPPSKAHSLLAEKAISNDSGPCPARILLLLATQNADKKPKPAVFEDRVAMMTLMAQSLYRKTQTPVDVGVTKMPFFVDKAGAIDEAGIYVGDGEGPEQVHLTGYDTITRIFNPKYYPEDQKLKVLEPFLARHRLRVTYRLGGEYGDRNEQDRYVESIGDGSRRDEGMKDEWRSRIDMADDAKEGVGVSSTEARNAVIEQRTDDLSRYVEEDVARYIIEMGLYLE